VLRKSRRLKLQFTPCRTGNFNANGNLIARVLVPIWHVPLGCVTKCCALSRAKLQPDWPNYERPCRSVYKYAHSQRTHLGGRVRPLARRVGNAREVRSGCRAEPSPPARAEPGRGSCLAVLLLPRTDRRSGSPARRTVGPGVSSAPGNAARMPGVRAWLIMGAYNSDWTVPSVSFFGGTSHRKPGRSAAVVEGDLVAVGVRERESAAERPVDGR
jgi:hypothetical protein